MFARGLRKRASGLVGCVVGDMSHPCSAALVAGVEAAYCDGEHALLLAVAAGDEPSATAGSISLLSQHRVDGLLVALATEGDAETLGALAAVEAPIVAADCELPAHLGASAVLADYRAGMVEAIETLFEFGHRRVGLVLGERRRCARELHVGLAEAYAGRGLAPTFEVVAADGDGRAAAARLLRGSEPPTAIVVSERDLLLGVLEELRLRDLGVGDAVALITCEELPVPEWLGPPVALLRRDDHGIGREAVRLLRRRIADTAGEPETVVLPMEFVQKLGWVRRL